MLYDYLVSLVRTVVPTAVASVLTYAATRWGIVLDENTSANVAIGATGLVLALYYGLVRALETKWPAFGRLLGKKAQPTYVNP